MRKQSRGGTRVPSADPARSRRAGQKHTARPLVLGPLGDWKYGTEDTDKTHHYDIWITFCALFFMLQIFACDAGLIFVSVLPVQLDVHGFLCKTAQLILLLPETTT